MKTFCLLSRRAGAGPGRAGHLLCAQSPLPCGFLGPPLLKASLGMRLGRVHRQGGPRGPLSGLPGRRASRRTRPRPVHQGQGPAGGPGVARSGPGGDRPCWCWARGLAFFPQRRAEGVDLGPRAAGHFWSNTAIKRNSFGNPAHPSVYVPGEEWLEAAVGDEPVFKQATRLFNYTANFNTFMMMRPL